MINEKDISKVTNLLKFLFKFLEQADDFKLHVMEPNFDGDMLLKDGMLNVEIGFNLQGLKEYDAVLQVIDEHSDELAKFAQKQKADADDDDDYYDYESDVTDL